MERFKEVFLLSLEKRRLREHPVTVFQHLRGREKENGVFLFTRGHMEKANDNGYKSQGKGFMSI